MRRSITRWALLLLLSGFLSGPAVGQPVRTYEPFVPTQEFREAFRMVDRGEIRAGVQKFREIAARNPGTTLGAMSLFRVAFWAETSAEQRATYQAIIVEYPRSRFEIDARISLAELDHPENLPQLQAFDEIVRAYGGPGLQEIVRANNRNQMVRQLRALPTEFQDGLAEVYETMVAILMNGLHRYEDALRLSMFMREAFTRGITSFRAAGNVFAILTIKKLGDRAFKELPPPAPPREPDITIKKPRPDSQTGPRPKIRVECTAGDYRQSYIDVEKIQLKLDGQDLRPVMEVRSKYDPSLRLNQPFERMLLIARPTQRLSPGRHTITLEVPARAMAQRSWSFWVSRARDEADDECEDGDDW